MTKKQARVQKQIEHGKAQARAVIDAAIVEAAEDFVQLWIAHPREPEKVGPAHAYLIYAVLSKRVSRIADRLRP